MTTTPARAADADLATDAASGDVGAYASLYHRHVEAAWRLAQATATSAEAAARATTNAFVGVIRLSGRGRDDVADQFRLHLLAATYREAHSGSGRAPAAAVAVAAGSAAGGDRLVTAFANLPSRWRAAVWLQEVEGLPATAAGPILGVSGAAAVQLKKRGLAGLEHRVLQAGGSLPLPELASALGAGVAPVPAEVRAKTEAKWKRAVGRDRRQAAVTGGWLTQRAPRPLAAAAVGLCAIGIVGLVVVGPSGTIKRLAPAAPVASGAPAVTGGGVTGGLTGGGTTSSGGTPIVGGTANNPGAVTASGSAGVQGPHLVATAPAATVSVPTTLAPVDTTLPTVTLPPVTLPPVTLPPVTLPPVTLPPVTLPPPVTTPPAATTPVVQVNLNTGILGVNLGIGPGSCTGVQLLALKIGCTGGPPGLSLGGTLLGGK